jgi:hypothetical protein
MPTTLTTVAAINAIAPPACRRRRLRLSVRMMMVLILASACGLGWVVSQTREQWLAVRAIVARGGIVEYDYKYDSARNRRLPNGTPWRPVWLQKVLGYDYFHNVVGVSLDDVATDADLVHIARLRHLKLLYLGGGRVTDDGLKHLQNLTDLRLLILWGNPISATD